MAVATPDWLARHGGEVRTYNDGASFMVYFDNEPQYALVPMPVKGQFGCRVTQTINGKRLDSPITYATADAACQGGLEDLRKALGW